MSEIRPAPYPADTQAKGWRFELDMETIEKSETWLRAKRNDVRAFLLLLWAKAWQQNPCGSLPADDELVELILGLPAGVFEKHRAVLLRNWWLADDGRRYHDTITQRVLAMMDKKNKDRQRQADRRARIAAKVTKESEDVTRDKQVTHLSITPESDRNPTPSTKHQAPSTSKALPAGELSRAHTHEAPPGSTPTPADATKAMRAAGMASVNPQSPKLLALLEAGITVDELAAAARDSVAAGKGFAYALAMAEGRRRDAATPPLPAAGLNRQEALEASNRRVADDWARGQTSTGDSDAGS